ncbi:MAG: HAD-IIIA family hydrolase [Synergistaceae bacterium]|jgi:histidinol-phosphate phosphatase family protein|nr:HAD-IIIA family hydrolase [Synergistaceae bacterium]
MANRAIFLDRDGVITANVYYERWGEWEAPMTPDDAVILPGAVDAMLMLRRAGFHLFIVSNQGASAKGKVPLATLASTIKHVEGVLVKEGVEITESYYSFTHPRGTAEYFSGASLERKPSPYFLLVAAAKYAIDLPGSWMIGDRDTDVLCGQSAGCKTVQIEEVHGRIADGNNYETNPDYRAESLYDASRIILGMTSRGGHA